jgi:hypothetical protein
MLPSVKKKKLSHQQKKITNLPADTQRTDLQELNWQKRSSESKRSWTQIQVHSASSLQTPHQSTSNKNHKFPRQPPTATDLRSSPSLVLVFTSFENYKCIPQTLWMFFHKIRTCSIEIFFFPTASLYCYSDNENDQLSELKCADRPRSYSNPIEPEKNQRWKIETRQIFVYVMY